MPICSCVKKYPAVLCSLLFFSLFPAALPSQAAFVQRVEAGFDGKVKSNHWVPVRFFMENNSGRTLEGKIRLSLGNENLYFSCPVNLPSPGRKVISTGLFLNAPYASRLDWQLIAEGRLIEGNTIDIQPVAEEDLILLALHSRFSSINLLQGKKIAGGAGAIHLFPYSDNQWDQLPDQEFLYDAVDGILIGGTDPGRLGPSQIEAIRQWTLAGGRLIACGGPAGDQLAGSWVEPLLPVRLTGQLDMKELSAFPQMFGTPVDTSSDWVVTGSEILPDSAMLMQEGSLALMARGSAGLGRVTFLAFDPTTPRLAAWAGLDSFLDFLIGSAEILQSPVRNLFARESHNRYYYMGYNRSETPMTTLLNDPLFEPPSFRLVVLLLGSYILLVGPINFLILRYKKKMELAWITIPVIVAIFLALQYGLGTYFKGSQVVVNSLELVLGRQGVTALTHQRLLSLFSPGKTSYQLSIALPQSRIYPVNSDSFLSQEKRVDLQIQDGVQVASLPMNMWTMDLLRAESPYPIAEPIGFEVISDREETKVIVDNSTALEMEFPYLFWNEKYYPLPPIPAGESLEFALSGEKQGNSPSEKKGHPVGMPQMNNQPYSFFFERGEENPHLTKRAESLFNHLHKHYISPQSALPKLLVFLPDLPDHLSVNNDNYQSHREILLCLEGRVVRPSSEFIEVPAGLYQVRWPLGQENYEKKENDEVVFSSGELIAELAPQLGLPRPQNIQEMYLFLKYTNTPKINHRIDIYDWQGASWIPVIGQSDEGISSEIDLTTTLGRRRKQVLRPGDQAVRIRFQVLAAESQATASSPVRGMPGMGYRGEQGIQIEELDLKWKGTVE